MLDIPTVLATRATILAVMVVVFATAWTTERRPHWMSWIVSSALGSAALFLMMAALETGTARLVALGQTLLIVANGTSWQAARQFGRRSASWMVPVVIPALTCAPLFADLPKTPTALVWALTGLVGVIQHIAIMWEFWRDRGDGILSRYWLVVAYGAFVLACLFAVFNIGEHLGDIRVFERTDLSMQLHLWLVLIHTVGICVFRLSLGLECNARDLRQLSLTDTLTGVPNRRAFEHRYTALSADPTIRSHAVALIDVDHFKRINDHHGHATGDAALQACASIIRNVVSRDALLARFGGEEFVVLMLNVSAAQANAAMDVVRASVAATRIMADQQALSLTVSIGVCHTPRA